MISDPRWLKHNSCNMWHQQQVVIKCAIQLTQNQCKKCATQSTQVDKHVWHNRHKSIKNMIHLDKHMCMYQYTMNLFTVRYLHIQLPCTCTPSTLPFKYQQVHNPKNMWLTIRAEKKNFCNISEYHTHILHLHGEIL